MEENLNQIICDRFGVGYPFDHCGKGEYLS